MAGWRPALAVAAGALLMAGCTDGPDGEPDAKGTPGSSATASPTTTASATAPATASAPASSSASSSAGDEPYTLAEDRAPHTRAEAVAFVRGLGVRPDYFGAGFRRRDPFESDPAEWAVLGDDCLWRREALPDTALASLTRAFELPEQGAKGPVYVSLTITVHRDALAARRDMARSLESALRCPDQRLNSTDVVSGLYSRLDAYTDARSAIGEDDLMESGDWAADGTPGSHPFDWVKYRVGLVTVAATARHGAGRDKDEDSTVTTDAAQGVSLVAADIDRLGDAPETEGARR